ncbi:hypothetical protein NQT62_04990, partial [Limnobacter humi]
GLGNDNLLGSAGNDSLYGDAGDDRLEGGAGNDYLDGDLGNDTYVFGKGDGQDTMVEDYYETNAARVNTLLFKTGVLPTELNLQASGSDLVIKINGTTDQITVRQFFTPDEANILYNPLQQIKFADGTTWSRSTIISKHLAGTTGDDSLHGTQAADTINSQAGNDYVYGAEGNDTIHGGDGNDYLSGDDGNDLLTGGNGDDSLYGGLGTDRLDGGAGNDYLDGGTGNDTYVFGRGYGQDVINHYDLTTGKVDAISFNSGVAQADIVVTRFYSDLVLGIKGTTDTIRVSNHFSSTGNNPYDIDRVTFADGTFWDQTKINSLVVGSSTVV